MSIQAIPRAQANRLTQSGATLLRWRAERDPKKVLVPLRRQLAAVAALRGKVLIEFGLTDDDALFERSRSNCLALLDEIRSTLRLLEGATFEKVRHTANVHSPGLAHSLEQARAGALLVLHDVRRILEEFTEAEAGADRALPEATPPGTYGGLGVMPLPG